MRVTAMSKMCEKPWLYVFGLFSGFSVTDHPKKKTAPVRREIFRVTVRVRIADGRAP